MTKRINSTTGLTAAARKRVRVARDLDAILSHQLRDTDPALYAEWKRAVHIQSRKRTKETAGDRAQSLEAAPQSGDGSAGTLGATPPAQTEAPLHTTA